MMLPGIRARLPEAPVPLDEAEALPVSRPRLMTIASGLPLSPVSKEQVFPKEVWTNPRREDFKALELIGKGGYGEVKLVEYLGDGKLYAMKIIDKQDIRERRHLGDTKAAESPMVERDIGIAARDWNCPFIVELYATFQSPEKLYYVYEICVGGELLELVKAQPEGHLTENATRFYSAEIAFALAFLHTNNVIHRDVKLENVLLASDGHVKLADFGSGSTDLPETGTQSLFGSTSPLIFMPPEYRRGELYGKDLDCFQLGVATFAMIWGDYPASDNMQELPLTGTSEALNNLVRALLSPQRESRLGFPGGAELVKRHKFYEFLDWETVGEKALKPPFICGEASSPVLGQGIEVRDTMDFLGSADVLKLRGFTWTRE